MLSSLGRWRPIVQFVILAALTVPVAGQERQERAEDPGATGTLAESSLSAAGEFSIGWATSLGLYDFEDSGQIGEMGFDYRWAPRGGWKLIPHAGVGFSIEESVYAYFGFGRDFQMGSWFVTPSVALALQDGGDGKDLGHLVEFRSGLTISRQFPKGTRLGIGFFHLSNSRLSTTNPGANSLLLRLFLPGNSSRSR